MSLKNCLELIILLHEVGDACNFGGTTGRCSCEKFIYRQTLYLWKSKACLHGPQVEGATGHFGLHKTRVSRENRTGFTLRRRFLTHWASCWYWEVLWLYKNPLEELLCAHGEEGGRRECIRRKGKRAESRSCPILAPSLQRVSSSHLSCMVSFHHPCPILAPSLLSLSMSHHLTILLAPSMRGVSMLNSTILT